FGRTVTLNAGTGTGTITNLATGPISFDESGLGNLDIKGGSGNNTFNVLNTPADLEIFGIVSTLTDIDSGAGNHTVNVLGTSRLVLSIEGQSGCDTGRIGNGSLQGIQEQVGVFNTGGVTSLFVDGSADANPQNVTMSVGNGIGRIDGLAPAEIFYKGA